MASNQLEKDGLWKKHFHGFDNYRRLCRNYELTFDSAEEMVKLASTRMLLNKI